MSKSIIRDFFIKIHIFGFILGLIFPLYATLFVNYKTTTHQVIFVISAIMAGLFVGGFSYFLAKKKILKVIKDIAYSLNEIETSNDLSILINVKSDDEIGLLVDSTNRFVERINLIISNISEYSNILEDKSISFKSMSSEMKSKSVNSETETENIADYIKLVKNKSENISNRLSQNVDLKLKKELKLI